jgi:O-antigen/teichoic acid export membrane protein
VNDLVIFESPAEEPQITTLPGYSRKATIARNIAFVLGLQVILKIIGFLFNVYIVRNLGAEHFGRYSAVMAYVAIFAIFTDWGISPYSVREMAQNPSLTSSLLSDTVAIRLIFSFFAVIITPLSALFLGKDSGMAWGIFIASTGLFLYAFQGPLENALIARERLDYTSVFGLVNQLLFWGVGVWLLVQGWGFMGLIVASMCGVAGMALLSGLALYRMGLGRPSLAVRRWPSLFVSALPFGISGIAHIFTQRFDIVLMSFILTDTAVGWYNAPLTLINMVLLIAQSIAIAMYPSLVRSHKEDPATLPELTLQSIRYLLMICLPMAIGGTVLARRIIIALYTPVFANSVPVFQVILWALPSLFLLEILGRLAATLHLERQAARLDMLCAGIAVVLNVVLIPYLGILGAALGLLGSRTIRLVLYWRFLGNQQLVGRRWGALLRLSIPAVLMGIVVYVLGRLPALVSVGARGSLLLLLGIGAGTYIASLLLFGAIERGELVALRSITLGKLARGAAK